MDSEPFGVRSVERWAGLKSEWVGIRLVQRRSAWFSVGLIQSQAECAYFVGQAEALECARSWVGGLSVMFGRSLVFGLSMMFTADRFGDVCERCCLASIGVLSGIAHPCGSTRHCYWGWLSYTCYAAQQCCLVWLSSDGEVWQTSGQRRKEVRRSSR